MRPAIVATAVALLFLPKTSPASNVNPGSQTIDAVAQTDASLGSWTFDGEPWSARVEDGTLIVRQADFDYPDFWVENGAALNDLSCLTIAWNTENDGKRDIEIFVETTGFPNGPNRAWDRGNKNKQRVYDDTKIQLWFEANEQDAALATGNKIAQATGGRVGECEK